jgi:hypothetical protein
MLETMLNGNPVEVTGLDAEWLLDLAAETEVRERQAGRAKLRVAAQRCVLHPATEESGFVTCSDTGLPGLDATEEGLGGEGPRNGRVTPEPFGVRSLAKTKLYLHLNLTDLLGFDGSDGSTSSCDGAGFGTGFGSVERFGPATLARIKDWVGRSRVTIQPVLDMARTDAVDAHDPPAWVRELVILRDRQCVFPFCNRDARACDVDHISPYEENGPPGQTRPDALAALCRQHHRAKTFRRWRYHRTSTGAYQWTGPHGQTYLVTRSDTVPIAKD